MTELRKPSRRSFLRQVAGGAVGVGAMAIIGTEAAGAAATNGATVLDPARSDSDPSDPSRSDSDPVGVNTQGCSDSDRGRNADPVGRGRHCGRRPGYTGLTDSDTGRGRDAPGYGHGRRRNCTDSDTGRADPARGRNSDNDRGVRDPAGRGRHC